MSYTRVDKPAALTHAALTQILVGASADSGAGGAVAPSDPVGLGQAGAMVRAGTPQGGRHTHTNAHTRVRIVTP